VIVALVLDAERATVPLLQLRESSRARATGDRLGQAERGGAPPQPGSSAPEGARGHRRPQRGPVPGAPG
jgi:hypothetical protein